MICNRSHIIYGILLTSFVEIQAKTKCDYKKYTRGEISSAKIEEKKKLIDSGSL